MTSQTTITLSAPAKSGYNAEFESIEATRIAAAELLGVTVDDMIEVESGDGGTTYCYASQADAAADQDGAYAVQYSATATESEYVPVATRRLRSLTRDMENETAGLRHIKRRFTWETGTDFTE